MLPINKLIDQNKKVKGHLSIMLPINKLIDQNKQVKGHLSIYNAADQ